MDDERLDPLFRSMPVSGQGTLVQYAGRLHRLHPGKTKVRNDDYVDREVTFSLRTFEKRLRGYRAIGYARDEKPVGHDPGKGTSDASTDRTHELGDRATRHSVPSSAAGFH